MSDNNESYQEASPFIAERLNIERILKRAAKYWDGGYAMEGMIYSARLGWAYGILTRSMPK